MDSDGLPIVGAGIDYTTVEPIQHKRILSYVNHFVMQTANMLNHWSNTCEQKLSDVTRRIRKLEATVALLETKLASIPGLEDVKASTEYTPPTSLQGSEHSSGKNESATSSPSSSPAPAATAAAPPKAATGEVKFSSSEDEDEEEEEW